jgi:hypothetical protein
MMSIGQIKHYKSAGLYINSRYLRRTARVIDRYVLLKSVGKIYIAPKILGLNFKDGLN